MAAFVRPDGTRVFRDTRVIPGPGESAPDAGVPLLLGTYPIDVIASGDGGAAASIRFESRFDLVDPTGVQQLDASRQSWEELAMTLPAP